MIAAAATQASPPSRFISDDDRWAALVRRDKTADGLFYYSVSTTGVYCRPSCASRLALRKNVRYHLTCKDAERAGFRPCKRCKPNAPPREKTHAEMIAVACREIETAEDAPSLETLAKNAGVSRYHFHRIFKAATGVTPKAYAVAHRAQRLRNELPQSAKVTDAMYDTGFNASSRFYDAAPQALGMTPNKFRTGGAGVRIHFAVGECTLGSILVATTEKGVCAILLGDDPDALVHDLQDRFTNAQLVGGDAKFEKLVAQVIGFIESPAQEFDLPLDVRGTAFQQRVWAALQKIPSGATASYADIAKAIGSPRAVRAVAQACGANALAVAIPCHRVVRKDGALSGYRWGVERKKQLLARESKP